MPEEKKEETKLTCRPACSYLAAGKNVHPLELRDGILFLRFILCLQVQITRVTPSPTPPPPLPPKQPGGRRADIIDDFEGEDEEDEEEEVEAVPVKASSCDHF